MKLIYRDDLKKFLLRSFRLKLVGIYSFFLILSFLTFSHWIFDATKSWLYGGVDNALLLSGQSIGNFLHQMDIESVSKNDSLNNCDDYKNQYCGKDSIKEEARSLELLKIIHESITLNPKRHYIQIIDNKSDEVIWKSKNMIGKSLPTFPNEKEFNELRTYAESVYDYDTIPRYIYRRSLKGTAGDTVFTNIPFEGLDMRLHIVKTTDHTISIGYSLTWIQSYMDKLSNIFYVGLPIILFILIVLLLIVSKFGFYTIEEMTEKINTIRPNNLNVRMPVIESKDELARHSDAVNRLLDMVEKNFNKYKNFTYDASHELKTPLTILRGELELALNHTETIEEYQTVIASSLDEIIRLSNVVETLLELARAENGKVMLNYKNINLSCLLTDIVQDIEIIAEDKYITLKSNIESDVFIEADKSRLHQAILNLLENSVKYTPENGSIYVEMLKKDDSILLSIKDTGVGISEECKNMIFEKFYRTTNVKDAGIPGTGLGLSIVKWVIDSHNGQIEVESELGKGTNFIITIPIKQNGKQ